MEDKKVIIELGFEEIGPVKAALTAQVANLQKRIDHYNKLKEPYRDEELIAQAVAELNATKKIINEVKKRL